MWGSWDHYSLMLQPRLRALVVRSLMIFALKATIAFKGSATIVKAVVEFAASSAGNDLWQLSQQWDCK